MNQNSWKYTGLVATVMIVLTIPLSLFMNRNQGKITQPSAGFTGGEGLHRMPSEGIPPLERLRS